MGSGLAVSPRTSLVCSELAKPVGHCMVKPYNTSSKAAISNSTAFE